MNRTWALVFLLFISSCHKAQTQIQPPPVSPVPAVPPEYEVAYQDGLKAFREATPDGYQRAADAFRKASTLRPSTCEYALHLSESLFFLAQEREANWEESQPMVQQASDIVSARQDTPECATLSRMWTACAP